MVRAARTMPLGSMPLSLQNVRFSAATTAFSANDSSLGGGAGEIGRLEIAPIVQPPPPPPPPRAGPVEVTRFPTIEPSALTRNLGTRNSEMPLVPAGASVAHPVSTAGVFATLTELAGKHGDLIDWRVGADFKLTDENMIYGQVSTGFKGGGSNPRPFNAFQLLSFAPETLTAYEIGVKSDLFDRRLRLNVSAFQNEYNNIQVGVSPCPLAAGVDAVFATPSACRINGGNARIKGLELEMNAEPVDGLRLDGSVSYIHFAYQSVTPPILITDRGTGMPTWKWGFGVQYEVDMGDSGSITPRFDVNHQDVTFTGYDGTGVNRLAQFLPAFTVANARLTWRNEDRDLSVALEVTNLFDRYYFYSVFDQRNNNGGRIGAPARPREWALTVRKEF